MTDPKGDEQRRDEVLKRMLATPPKPHDDSKGGRQKIKENEPQPKDENFVDADSALEKKEGGGVPVTFSRPKPTR